jgi:uncharacterized protein YqgC (DUF456 family)
MSDTRYWLLVLLIPLFGVWLVGLQMGPVEVMVWLVLAAAWLVAFFKHDRIRAWVPLAVFGVVVMAAGGIAAYNHANTEGSSVTVERQ